MEEFFYLFMKLYKECFLPGIFFLQHGYTQIPHSLEYSPGATYINHQLHFHTFKNCSFLTCREGKKYLCAKMYYPQFFVKFIGLLLYQGKQH